MYTLNDYLNDFDSEHFNKTGKIVTNADLGKTESDYNKERGVNVVDNNTMNTLLSQVKKTAIQINDNGGLDYAFNNEDSDCFALYELLVKYIDEVFYKICEEQNLSVDKYYPIIESAIKAELPTFTY